MNLSDVFYQLALQDPQMRQTLMQQQMNQAQSISDAVPRGLVTPFQWDPPALPELPPNYRPPERWQYGKPVRLAGM